MDYVSSHELVGRSAVFVDRLTEDETVDRHCLIAGVHLGPKNKVQAVNVVMLDTHAGGQSDGFGRHRLEISNVQYGARRGPKGKRLEGEGCSYEFVQPVAKAKDEDTEEA